jgi:hypothetical protein
MRFGYDNINLLQADGFSALHSVLLGMGLVAPTGLVG